MHVAALIFALTYLLISLGENSPRKLDRPTAAMCGAVLMVVSGSLTRSQAAASIDISTLVLLFGMMVLLAIMTQSGLPGWIAVRSLNRCNGPQSLLALVVFSSGVLSALMLNDTVCLIGTPLVLHITSRTKTPAAPFLLALATSANIGSVMTLTGNPQNMIIGHDSGWSWIGFAFRMVPIGLVCLVANFALLRLLFSRELAGTGKAWPDVLEPLPEIDKRLAIKSIAVFGALIVAFLAGAPMDVAALCAAIVLLILANRPPALTFERVDWTLLLFFTALFVVVEGFVNSDQHLLQSGMDAIGTRVDWANIFRLSGVSLIGSNLFSNVPFVLIVGRWINGMSDPRFVWLLISLTSTFAGNLTLFGSVANVIVAQGAQKESPLGFYDFLRAGVPITVITTTLGVALLCLIWKLGLT